jgi:hypothetical protein
VKSWLVETSADGENWWEVARKEGNEQLPFEQLSLSGRPHFSLTEHGSRALLSKGSKIDMFEEQIATPLRCGGDL